MILSSTTSSRLRVQTKRALVNRRGSVKQTTFKTQDTSSRRGGGRGCRLCQPGNGICIIHPSGAAVCLAPSPPRSVRRKGRDGMASYPTRHQAPLPPTPPDRHAPFAMRASHCPLADGTSGKWGVVNNRGHRRASLACSPYEPQYDQACSNP